jgi:hypothetical protein
MQYSAPFFVTHMFNKLTMANANEKYEIGRKSQTADYVNIISMMTVYPRTRFAKDVSLLTIWPKDTHRHGLGFD